MNHITNPDFDNIQNDEIEDIALPSIDSFSFDAILKAIDPAVTTTLDSVGKLCEEYQTSLRTEVDALTDAQAEIDAMIKEADKLTNQAFKTTKMRTERLDAEAVGLKGGSAADALAAAAEATHTSLTSIITTLLAIDEMLPVQERLSPLLSAHKKHYPRLHTLLADKAHEIEVRFRNVRSPEMRPVSRPLSVQTLMSRLDLDLGESSSSRTTIDPSSSWSPRRRLSTSSTLLLNSPTVSRASTSYTHNRGVSSPHLQLRTILPSPSNEQISASGSYFPIAPKTATGVSLTSPMYTAQQHLEGSISPRPMSPLMSPRRPSGMWSRRASSGTIAAFMARDTDNSALYPSPRSGSDKDGGGTIPVGSNPANSKPPSTWRNSAGSWAGFFGGKGSRGSSEVSKGVSAEERLKMLLQAAGDGNSSSSSSKKKGKGKGVQR
ncbi:hypothetical protein DFP73DRAFT_565635 [Morchella snyderi]|nr:hypothetical protein DFP73DRAFT_565635 [Morchella snyderi]